MFPVSFPCSKIMKPNINILWEPKSSFPDKFALFFSFFGVGEVPLAFLSLVVQLSSNNRGFLLSGFWWSCELHSCLSFGSAIFWRCDRRSVLLNPEAQKMHTTDRDYEAVLSLRTTRLGVFHNRP